MRSLPGSQCDAVGDDALSESITADSHTACLNHTVADLDRRRVDPDQPHGKMRRLETWPCLMDRRSGPCREFSASEKGVVRIKLGRRFVGVPLFQPLVDCFCNPAAGSQEVTLPSCRWQRFSSTTRDARQALGLGEFEVEEVPGVRLRPLA